jgi:hypothetical protein
MYEIDFLVALLITIFVEFCVLYLLIRKQFRISKTKLPTERLILISIIASGLTLPYFWFVLPAFITQRVTYLIIGEGSIFLIEAILYHKLLEINLKIALTIALICNVASILAGLLLHIAY